jgi:hypothetical protein
MSAVQAQTETDEPDSLPVFDEPRHEISLLGGGGISALNYSLNMSGSKTDGTGGISGFAGIAYTWNINNSIGVVTGLDVMSYGAKTTYDAISVDKDFSWFTFSYKIDNYVEEHSVTYLSIPVMFQYSVPLSGSKKFYMSGGFKVGFPIQSKATMFPGNINTWGSPHDVLGHDYVTDDNTNLSKYGFVRNETPGSITGDIDVTALLAVSLETGARFFLTKNILLYTSVYLDYGLNNIRKSRDNNLINYQELTPAVLRYASVLNTQHVNKVKTLGAGLKVKVSFGW